MLFRLIGLLAPLAMLFLQGCITLPPFAFGSDRGKVAIEQIEKSEHFWTVNEILMIPLDGEMEIGDTRSKLGGEPGMLVALKDRLKEAEKNPRLKAVILRINSPGGSVTAADLIYHEITKFREGKKIRVGTEERNIPVVVMMTDMAASGGLYASMAADEIYALPTTITGSIGVISILPGVVGLANKVGVEFRVIESGKFKSAGSPFSTMNEEERKIFQALIDKYYSIFFNIVLSSRKDKGLSEPMLRAIADGRILDADTALQNHLIDGIKYPKEVIERTKELAGIQDARIITYEYPFSYRGNVYARQGELPRNVDAGPKGGAGDINLLKLDMGEIAGRSHGPKFMYLCQ